MTHRTLVVALAVVGLLLVVSASSPPPNPAEAHNGKTEANQRNTQPPAPGSVEVPAEQHQGESAPETRKVGNWISDVLGWLVNNLATLIIAAIAALQWRAFLAQAKWMRESADAARDAIKEARASAQTAHLWTIQAVDQARRTAKAMEDVAANAQKNAERQLRAYVFCQAPAAPQDGSRVRVEERGDLLAFHLRAVNAGNTPAADGQCKIVVIGKRSSPIRAETGFDLSDISPGGHYPMVVEFSKQLFVPPEGAAYAAFHIGGWIVYKDVFKRERKTRFVVQILYGRDTPDGPQGYFYTATTNDDTC